jgi:hypothetical protein
MEIVAKKMAHSGGDWMKPVYTNTFGLNFCATGQRNEITMDGINNDDIDNWLLDNRDTNNHEGNIAPEVGEYYHYTYVYDHAAGKVISYVDGVKIDEHADKVTSGKRLAIGGYPKSDTRIQHPYQGTIAVVRIWDNVATAEEVKASYDALNLKKPAQVNVLFDAQFSENNVATNVGTDQSLVITPKLGANDKTIKRGDRYVISLNPTVKNNDHNVASGYYYIDYKDNESFKNNLYDGFTMEVLCRVTEFEGNYWSKPFGTTACYIHNSPIDDCKWGFDNYTPENRWDKWGAWGQRRQWPAPANVGSYDHIIRDNDDCVKHKNYILENPRLWHLDEMYCEE